MLVLGLKAIPIWMVPKGFLPLYRFVIVQGRSFCSDPRDTRRRQTPAKLHEVPWPHHLELPGSRRGLKRTKMSHSTGDPYPLTKVLF